MGRGKPGAGNRWKAVRKTQLRRAESGGQTGGHAGEADYSGLGKRLGTALHGSSCFRRQ